MALAFAQIAFTPKVRAAQQRMGSRDAYQATDLGEAEIVALSAYEIGFIRARDSFYQGTVGENGWPYVQHRGGPTGFLKVLDSKTLGYADFSGNRQYISVGNLEGDDRVNLFLMDYPGQRRLKIWGRARLVDEDTEPALVARLESPDYRARVERGVVITVEAFDWNCPKYITPRFTEREVDVLIRTRRHDEGVSAQDIGESEEIGAGQLKLVVSGIRQLTPQVRAYELRAADERDLPAVTAGAHLSVPVRLPDGSVVNRQYSLASHHNRHDRMEIAVLREEDGRGGSAAIHATWTLGTRLALDLPANQFPLHADDRYAVLVAGGIGITPIRAMAQALKARGSSFDLHYSGRTPAEMAYRIQLEQEFPGQLHLNFSRTDGGKRLDLQAIIQAAPSDAVFYICGPGSLIETAHETARKLGVASGRLQYENFE